MSAGIVNDVIQENLHFLELHSGSIIDKIAELHANDTSSLIALSYDELSNQQSNILQDLSTVQTKFNEVYTLVAQLKNSQNKNTSRAVDLNNRVLKLSSLIEVLEPFQHGSIAKRLRQEVLSIEYIDESVKSEIELVCQLEDLIVLYALLSIYQIITTRILNSTIPISDNILYWETVGSSGWRTGFYLLQTLPYRISGVAQNVFKDFKQTATPDISSLDIEAPKYLVENYGNLESSYKLLVYYFQIIKKSLYDNIFANNLRNFYKLIGTSKKIKSFTKHDRRPNIKNYLSIMIGTPLISINEEVENKQKALTDLQNSNARKLGSLIINIPDLNKLNSNKDQISHAISFLKDSILNTPDKCNETDHLVSLYQIAKTSIPEAELKIKEIKKSNSIPSWLTRYWPSLFLLSLYGPSTVLSAISNKDEIIKFFKVNVVDTLKGFWENWILKPVNNVLSTIRHDDNSAISIMSQQSLESDLSSLKRMVIEYTLDSPEYRDLKPEVLEALKVQLSDLVSKGDLTPLMKDYEQDIKQPLKNLLKGKLTRALLIQIQKTKVDGAVAMSGIDKLLKSQELVFGIVAASPSLLILFYSIKALNSYIKNGYISRGSSERKLIVSRNLNNIERLLNELIFDGEDLDYITGRIILELISLRSSGLYIMPKSRRFDWINDINDLSDKKLQPQAKLNTIIRLHHTYSQYFI